ncbi:integrase [Bosea sp. OAE752]|uniref:integrase n=1 Tax=Bosea sp. OAE752 TaxID=2663873 RepID=UPI003D1B5B85
MTIEDDVTGAPIKIGVYDPEREATAQKFRAIAMELGTPADEHHKAYMSGLNVTYRTRSDDYRAMQYLRDWCDRKNVPFTLEGLRKPHAKAFCKEMGPIDEDNSRGIQMEVDTNLDPVTRKKYLTRLSAYWSDMAQNEKVRVNIWEDCKISVPKKPAHIKERHFTNDEVRRLLMGPAKQAMNDLMKLGALSGARIDAIVSLKVGDTADGAFTFKAMKSEPGPRDVPIHPDLEEIVARRSLGKLPTDDFFPEWPPVKKKDSMRERSFKASNQFTDYRRQCKVDDVHARVKIAPDGRRHYDDEPILPGEDTSGMLKLRRSRVNFHSFRRWFITRLEQAGVSPDLVSAMVGHGRAGTTMRIYSGGP